MSKHRPFVRIAKIWAEESTCASMGVGCVLVRDGHQISSGYNGTNRGDQHCNKIWPGRSPEHSAWSDRHEIHAEMNAIIHCPTNTQGSSAYCTDSPCWNCCKHLIGAGVISIYFVKKYDRFPEQEWEDICDYCKRMNVDLVQLNEDGEFVSIFAASQPVLKETYD